MRRHPLDAETRALSRDVRQYISDPTHDRFDALARRVFEHQYARNEPYRRFCETRGVSPDTLSDWREIPAVPTAAFKETTLACAPADRVFRTSGTTEGAERRGSHPVVDPSVYETAVKEGFRRFVLPDRERMRIVSLVPSSSEAPESSLSEMAAIVIHHFGDAESGTYVAENRLLLGALFGTLDRAARGEMPVLLFGTTLAFVRFVEETRAAGHRFRLPAGSRLIDTGGAKGRGREFDDPELLRDYEEVFGLPAAACVNEYGMTELFSQLYNDDLRRLLVDEEPVEPLRARKRHPHWMRVRVLDPETLSDADEGLVCLYDLANCHSVMAILTEDVARRDDEAIVLRGRRTGSEARGCSISMDDWLQS